MKHPLRVFSGFYTVSAGYFFRNVIRTTDIPTRSEPCGLRCARGRGAWAGPSGGWSSRLTTLVEGDLGGPTVYRGAPSKRVGGVHRLQISERRRKPKGIPLWFSSISMYTSIHISTYLYIDISIYIYIYIYNIILTGLSRQR